MMNFDGHPRTEKPGSGRCVVLTVDFAPNQEATSLLHGPVSDDRAFAVSAPSAWNSLPIDIRDCSSEATFKKHLKTFLFHVAFN